MKNEKILTRSNNIYSGNKTNLNTGSISPHVEDCTERISQIETQNLKNI